MIRNKQKGFALVLSLVLLLAMSLMGGGLVVIASSDHQGNNSSDEYQQTFYVAETALMQAEKSLVDKMTGPIDNTTGTTHGSDGTFVGLINGDGYLYNREAKSLIFGTSNNQRAQITGIGTFVFGKTTQGYTNNSEAQFDVHTTNGYINISKASDSHYGGLRIMKNNASDIGGYLGIAGQNGHFVNQAVQHDICLRSESKLLLRSNGGGDAQLQISGTVVSPGTDNTMDLGSSSLRWANVYTGDLNLSNKGSANDVDDTWGDYTIQEGESDLYLINNRNGKKYKFNLTEIN